MNEIKQEKQTIQEKLNFANKTVESLKSKAPVDKRISDLQVCIMVTIETQPVGCYTEVVCLYSVTCIYIVVTLGTQPVGCYIEVVCLYSGTCI